MHLMSNGKFSWIWKILWVFALVVILESSAYAAQSLGAIAATQAKNASQNQAAANLGAGPVGSGRGAGSDLRAIRNPSAPRPQTLTGLPQGMIPGDRINPEEDPNKPKGSVVFSGDPIAPIIGPEMVGSKLDRVCVIAAHVGYTVVRRSYTSTTLDSAYSYNLMKGRRRISTLYFDRSMTLRMVQ